MRRKDREVSASSEIFDILARCQVLRIAMHDEPYPYIVPVSFGMEVIDGKAIVYFHCAQQGMKLDLLRANPCVCVEGDIFIKVESTPHGITTRYESVIGRGECRFLTDADEIVHGLRLITDHYGYTDYPLERCSGIEHLLIGRILLDEITCPTRARPRIRRRRKSDLTIRVRSIHRRSGFISPGGGLLQINCIHE